MLPNELQRLIDIGEGAKIEFKRDDLRPEQLAREIVSFSNMNGGTILVGVEDDGSVSGLQRPNWQEWLMDAVVSRHVVPRLVPDYEEVHTTDGVVAVVAVPAGAAKPYAVQQRHRLDYYLRLGNTCQRATREQMARLFQIGGLLSVERLPIHGSTMGELDQRRLDEYFFELLGEEPSAGEREGEPLAREEPSAGEREGEPLAREKPVTDWATKLGHRDLLVPTNGDEATCCSYAAYALFALVPRRRLPQAGLRLIVYRGLDAEYDALLDEVLDIPFVGLGEQKPGRFVEQSLPDRALAYLQPHISQERLDGMTRKRFWDYPQAVIRELLVNAYAHRDWTRQNDVRLVVFGDRMEVTSPGALPNGMTIEKVLAGQQSPRNSNMVRILRDYGLMDDRGMGIRRQVVPLMREQNGAEPHFEAHEDYFRVVLPKGGDQPLRP